MHRIVENGILIRGGSSLAERLGCFTHLPFEEVKVRRKVGEDRRHTGTVKSEVLEQRRKDSECLVLAQFIEGFEELHHTLGGAFIERFNKRVGFETYFFRHLGRLLIQFHYGTLQSGSRHFHLLTVGVKSGGKSHNFGNCHFSGSTDAGHTLSKLHDKRLGSGTVLREVVDR